MKSKPVITPLFIVAALYDGILGVVFILAGSSVFAWYNVTPPNHFGYVQFPGALLIVFALMFLAVARKPEANRNLIPYGIMLKISYCGVVFYHWFRTGIPNMWKPFAIFDLVFLVLFIWAYSALSKPSAVESSKVE
ncbi:MAG: hypothetical protein GYA46_10910 [candidate division Zixibacteria bacterium]|nr:hypothetical protein [candidate division Zixibacteria bacterium]